MKMKETPEGKEKLLGVEEEVPLLVWLRTPASLMMLLWQLVVEKDREGEWRWQTFREAGFFAVFGPKFLCLWSMKIKPIYRRWKRDTLSFLVQNIGLGLTRKHPNHWFKVAMMNCQFCGGNGRLCWPLWGSATASEALISLNGLF